MSYDYFKPGELVEIFFTTNDGSGGAVAPSTAFESADVKLYKADSATDRSSQSGWTMTSPLDSIVGFHSLEIDLTDNTDAGFYAFGETYHAVLSPSDETVDSQTVVAVIGSFRMGYPNALVNTTIATLASQTSFTLSAGSASDDAYNGCLAVVHDITTGNEGARGYISDYTGSSLTVTLKADPGVFTMIATDNIAILPPSNTAAVNGNVITGTGVPGNEWGPV